MSQARALQPVDERAGDLDERLRALDARLTGPKGPFELGRRPDGAPCFVGGPLCLGDIYSRARRMGEKPLVSQGTGRWTYSEILEPAYGLAARLRLDGRAGKRVALLLEDGHEWLVWFVALTAAGSTCVLPPAGASRDLIARCLDAAGCRIVVATAAQAAGLPGLENLHGLEPHAPDALPAVAPQDEALVTFTSGSSGEPKGVVHSHRSMMAGHRNMMLAGALSSHMLPPRPGAPRPEAPSSLLVAPLSYIAGYSAFLLTLASGGRLVLARDSDGAEAVAALVRQEAVQSISGASVELLRQLMRLPNAAVSLQSLRRLQLHGAALQPRLIEEIGQVLPSVDLMTGYGMSETAGSIAAAPVGLAMNTRGGCGRLLPSVDLRVVDDTGASVPAGRVGHLEVRGAMVMQGYLDPIRTKDAFTRDGWYRCGDIGAVDAEGWLTVVDRSDGRLSEAAGAGSLTSRVEEALRTLVGVDDAVAMVSPLSDGLTVVVQVRPGRSPDLSAIGEAALAAAGGHGPIEIRLADALPRTASGKIDRQRLAS